MIIFVDFQKTLIFPIDSNDFIDGYIVIIFVDFQKTLIFQIDFNDFIQLWGQVGVTLKAFWGNFGVILGLRGWLWDTFGSLGHHIGQMMRICAGLVGPKSEKVHATAATSEF